MNADESPARGRLLGLAGLVALVTLALFASASGFEFLNYDDPDYVVQNPVVQRGLTGEGLAWAFTYQAANWHPLTWLSHMLDVELFGTGPGPMHAVNLGLHALNAVLCFLALAALTRRTGPAFLVALLFAVHPLRVQVVAWVSERKELLAGTFFFATLLAYARYARTRRPLDLGLVTLLLALGCMAKPVLVTLPFVLLLLDLWPLARAAGPLPASGARLWLEKLPLFAVVAASSVLTLQAQKAGGAVGELAGLTLVERLWTAGAGILAYVRASFWPGGLAAFYPHPLLVGKSVVVPGALGLALAAALSLGAFALRRRAPALFTGWFWFLGMLVPMLGLVQVGDQAWADRYTYLPGVGLALAAVYGASQLAARRPALASGLAGAAGVAAVLFALVTLRNLPHWHDSKALFERALAVTEGNWIASNNLGLVYLERRETPRARSLFEDAIRQRPNFLQARFNLGVTKEAQGDFPGAVDSYRSVLALRPGHAETLVRMATLARAEGSNDQAVEFFEQAVTANPDHPLLWASFARILLEMGQPDRAKNAALTALRADPNLAEALRILAEIALRNGELDEAGERLARAEALEPSSAAGHALRARWRFQRGDLNGARQEYERSIALDPSDARARHDFGTLLLTLGEHDAARQQFQALNDLFPGDPQALLGLAAVAAGKQQPAEAIELLQRALQVKPEWNLALINLGAAYETLGRWGDALKAYERSFQSGVPDPDASCAAAWILATGPDTSLLDGEKAVELATYAAQRQAEGALEVLTAAHARRGDFEHAVTAQEAAVQRARNADRKRELEQRLELYRAQKPYTRPR